MMENHAKYAGKTVECILDGMSGPMKATLTVSKDATLNKTYVESVGRTPVIRIAVYTTVVLDRIAVAERHGDAATFYYS